MQRCAKNQQKMFSGLAVSFRTNAVLKELIESEHGKEKNGDLRLVRGSVGIKWDAPFAIVDWRDWPQSVYVLRSPCSACTCYVSMYVGTTSNFPKLGILVNSGPVRVAGVGQQPTSHPGSANPLPLQHPIRGLGLVRAKQAATRNSIYRLRPTPSL